MRIKKMFDGICKRSVFLATLSLVCVLHAADQTWIDTNANNDWNTTDLNWDTGVVWANGNNAIFGGVGEVLDINGSVSVSNITFNATDYDIGDATIDGTLTLMGAPSVITVAADTTNTISEVLAGSGGLTKEGDGILVLTGASSPSTGNTIINAGTIQWGDTDVLPSGSVTVKDGATLQYTTPIKNDYNVRSFTIQGTGVDGSGAIINNSTYMGGGNNMNPLYLADDAKVANLRRTDPYTVRLQGHRLTKIGMGSWNMRGSFVSGTGGAITVDEGLVQLEISNGAIQSVDGGIIVNASAYFSLLSYNGPSRSCNVDADIVLNDAGIVGTSYNASGTTGIPQVAYYGTLTLNGDCAIQIAWGSTGETLINDETKRDTQTDVYSEIGGDGNLKINPANMALSGTITYPVILHATNTFTGSVALEKGTLILAPSGSVTNSPLVDVAAGTTLVVSNTVNALCDVAAIVISNDGNTGSGLTLAAGVDDAVGSILLGGVLQTTIGTYGSSTSGALVQNDEYFSGTGVIRITTVPSDMTWIDVNANNDWNISEPNWDAGVAWFQNANAIFTGTGEEIELDDPVMVGNMTFNADGYTIADTNENGSLTLSGAPSVVSVANTGESAAITKIIEGTGGLTKQGNGTLKLSGADSPSTGNTLVEEGILYWGAKDALPSGSVTIEDGATVDLGALTDLSANARTYTIEGAGTAGQGALIKTGSASIMSANGVNGLNLSADATIGGSSRFDLGGYIDFNGYVLTKTGYNSVPFRTANIQDSTGGVIINQGHMYLENANFTIAGPVVINSGGTLGTYVVIGDSRTFTMPITLNDGGKLWAAGQNPAGTSTFAGTIACSGTTYLYTGYSGSAGVNGGDMIVNSIISGTGTMIINDTATGRIIAADRTITLNAANTFSGAIQIERGTLLVSGTGSITNCTEIEIFSGAIVEIQNTGDSLSEEATIIVANDADNATGMTLAAGMEERVGTLILGGVTYGDGSGSFGSSASAADHKFDEYFSGTGILITPPLDGTLILVR
ncbi:MAG: autotransporter-associated beta strand repeat-containing protein [Kiritimatiellae bacterium]|jgi:fibronectin-binding autotransporter adhesin|nr:autotransporter-associated beta strand repeat-containing protein [Kiritimatiellia bacterium]